MKGPRDVTFLTRYQFPFNRSSSQSMSIKKLHGSFFDDLFNPKKDSPESKKEKENQVEDTINAAIEEDIDPSINTQNWQKELSKRSQEPPSSSSSPQMQPKNNDNVNEEEEILFNGYDMRDVIYAKFGYCFDLEFRPVTSLGGTSLYLNVMPFHSKSKQFRHESEYDYLCHLQAVVDILIKYDRLEYVLSQLYETDKMPRAGTSPLIAVPFRLDLEEKDLQQILRGG